MKPSQNGTRGFTAGRVVGGDRHHWRVGFPVATGHPGGPRGSGGDRVARITCIKSALLCTTIILPAACFRTGPGTTTARQASRAAGIRGRTLILPYMENQPLYEQLDEIEQNFPRTGCFGADVNSRWGRSPLQQQPVQEFICPSEDGPMQEISPYNASWSSPANVARASYYGNAGPVSSGPTDWGPPNVCGLCVNSVACPCVYGNSPERGRGFYHGHNPNGPGMLDMWANDISMKHVTDGSSNTIHVGETHGSILGSQQPGCFSTNAWMASFAVASTVWGINIDYLATLGWNQSAHDRNNFTAGCNYRSRHPGGAQFLMVDGAVTFMTDDTSLTLLANLGQRNDGRVGNEYSPPTGTGGGR